MSREVLEALSQNQSDVLRRVFGCTFIVEMGIIKEILNDGRVTVEMSASNKAEDIVITNCVLANIASSSITVSVKPNINDKVIVLFPRRYSSRMFSTKQNETVVSQGVSSYSVSGGIAVLMNVFQEEYHKNCVLIEDGCITLKLAYSKDDNKNLLTFRSNADGELTLVSNNVQVTTNKDSEITVTNGKATVTIDKSGNVTVDAQGKYTIKNSSTDLMQVVDGLAKELENLTTSGTPTSQSTSPASKLTIATWRQTKLNQLFSSDSLAQD